MVFLVVILDCFVRDCAADQIDTQQDDACCDNQCWQALEERIKVDLKGEVKNWKNKVMEEDINSQNNQQHTGQQMTALEKFNQFRRVDRIQMEQESSCGRNS